MCEPTAVVRPDKDECPYCFESKFEKKNDGSGSYQYLCGFSAWMSSDGTKIDTLVSDCSKNKTVTTE